MELCAKSSCPPAPTPWEESDAREVQDAGSLGGPPLGLG